MGSMRKLALAGVAALMSTAALAADLPSRMQAPVLAPPLPVDADGWYLRRYIGLSDQVLDRISHPSFVAVPQFTFLNKGGFGNAAFFGGGGGYQWNSWLRTDVTGEYRGRAEIGRAHV